VGCELAEFDEQVAKVALHLDITAMLEAGSDLVLVAAAVDDHGQE
nr:hypothetical protein [Tanacetum cinerariifolium]